MTPTILVAGAFGNGDREEDVLLDAFARALPGWRLVATVHRRGVLVSDAAHTTVVASRPAQVHRALRWCDAVVLTGGGVFQRTRGARFGRIHRAALLAVAARAGTRPVAILGSGAPLLRRPSDRLAARALVHTADLLVLHDETSARLLATAGAPAPFRIGTDPAWALVDADEAPPSPGRDGIVVALDASACRGRVFPRLRRALAPLVRDVPVRLQPWTVRPGRVDDRQVAEVMAEHLPDVQLLPPPSGITDASATYRTAGAVLAMRPRATIAAAAAGTPVLTIGDSSRHATIAAGLDQPSVPSSADVEELRAAIDRVRSHPPPSREVVREHVDRALEAFRLLELVLTGGRSSDPQIVRLDLKPATWS